jgi:hypothetical protein
MAPEQERSGVVTVRTDVYSLGITLATLIRPLPQDWRAARSAATQWVELPNGMVDADADHRPATVGDVIKQLKSISRLLR